MEHATSPLYDLDGFKAAEVTVNPLGIRMLVLECTQVQGCPDCGTVTERVHSRRPVQVRDLPFGRPWLVRWNKRRMFCDQTRCPRRTFVERSIQLGPRQRLTTGCAASWSGRFQDRGGPSRTSPASTGCRGGASTTPWSPPPPASAARHRKGCGCSESTKLVPGRCAGWPPARVGSAPIRG